MSIILSTFGVLLSRISPTFVFPSTPLVTIPEGDERMVSQEVRLDNRILDLRTEANQGIFRIQVCLLHTPPSMSY